MLPETYELVHNNLGTALLGLALGGPIVLGLLVVIYNLYMSPLRAYPGPTLSAATAIPYIRALITGRISYYCIELHEKYGDVVRISPAELSYASSDAWKDIHGPRPGHTPLPKDGRFYRTPTNGIHSIISISHDQHGRMRRLLSHAFSEKALRDQEPLMRVHIDMLIQKLRDRAKMGEVVDMVSWYNWTTFDLIGDLSFGEPFDCLKEASYHPWVAIIFANIKMSCFLAAAERIPGATSLLRYLVPKSAQESRKSHQDMTEEKVNKRLARQTDRADFITPILNSKDEEGRSMSTGEMMSTANGLITAGSETTATLLSGATYHLLRNPDKMNKLMDEVRSTFKSEDEINLISVNSLRYMLAVLDESLRIYPPVPIGLPRVVPKGGEFILGKFVPEGTTVSINQWATYHSAKNFLEPESFIPERFLGEPRFNSDNKKALQPFSTGIRNCIGRNLAYAEMRLILARIIWNFDMELSSDSQDWANQEMYILWDKGPLNVKLRLAIK
ncbi:cytochrome P450 [Lepidopterella palustris CBS 459.81]|uniref:Cytochrome P450 n=1 Tax=Lepidopterella palustris CBS 459.81 TaxID=1314670 RepID=A0A8E2DWX5_9PEZI|nr:cytochrome P450 [Lepidopterella palustris CBS 459.81]